MTTYALFDPTSLVAGDTDLVARDVTILSGAAVNTVTPLPRGTVLGRITASDKYTVSVSGASDGSQVPRCVTAADSIDPSGGDVIAPCYFEGEFADAKMSFDSGWTAATLEAAFRQNNLPIFVRVVPPLG